VAVFGVRPLIPEIQYNTNLSKFIVYRDEEFNVHKHIARTYLVQYVEQYVVQYHKVLRYGVESYL
jgi:hypothetical protein